MDDKQAALDINGILGGVKDVFGYLGDPEVQAALIELGKTAPPAISAAAKLADAIQKHNAKAAA